MRIESGGKIQQGRNPAAAEGNAGRGMKYAGK
jgi:hypothetical protein